MNDGITRAETFAALKSLSDMVPQMRIGQMLAALGELCADLHGRGLWDAEDVEFVEAVWRFRRGIEDSTGGGNCSKAAPVAAADFPSARPAETRHG
ncbi:MAG TPA: hypothetical protein VMV69_29715 [Pirellulales bacterium]|nr:hypothetical protein [Pirellulales bacterium]